MNCILCIYIVLQPVQTPVSPSAPHIDIEIPCALKLKLEDDCYFIKRKKKVNVIIIISRIILAY